MKVAHFSSILAILILLAFLFLPGGAAARVASAASACATSGPSSGLYTVTVCLTAPADGSALSGVVSVTATVSAVGTSPGAQRMIFYLNGAYLLTEYQSPYSFNLPTARWVDGSYTLGVQALMRDGFTTSTASESVSFNNGVTKPPVNNNQFTPTSGTNPNPGAPFVVMAAGDGAGGEMNAAKVVSLIAAAAPNLFLYLGDVYESGAPTEFYNWYGVNGAYYSQFRSITDPTIGNHEYSSSSKAAGYFDYWDNIPNYYSFDAGGWHFISLNSNYSRIGVNAGSAQYNWLEDDLQANSGDCTIVYYHHPLFNIGPEGPTEQLADIWALLAKYHVTLALNGHDHDYQRWVPMDGSGTPDTSGVTEIVAGGGGHGLQDIVNTDSRVAYSNSTNPDAFGALKLSLTPVTINFSYQSITGAVLDSGKIPCANPAAYQAPAAPTGVSAVAAASNQVNVTWKAATDPHGIKSYTIYRDNAVLETVSGSVTSYQDTTVQPMKTYSYAVLTTNGAGVKSALSKTATVTTPGNYMVYLPLVMR